MKMRAALAATLILACITLAGCARVWSVDFTDPNPIDDWYEEGPVETGPDGLIMEGGFVSSPVAFDGDFTVTVIFDLDVDTLLNRANFAIWLSDGPSISPDNYINCVGRGLGNPPDEEYAVRDYTESELTDRYIVDEDAAFPGLIRQGRNTWKLVKKGEHITITMNGDTLVASFDIEHYAASQFMINIHGDFTGDGFLAFRSIKVVYYNNMIA